MREKQKEGLTLKSKSLKIIEKFPKKNQENKKDYKIFIKI